jgi:serine/threonine protein kinase
MTMEAAAVFRDALLGVKFLHDRGWMHLDLKPSNIGVTGEPRRCVLLDLGSSYLLEDESVEAQPGCGGTVTYLAPERELGPYNHSVDIWAMGIVGYELTYGSHPFKFLINPWRKGQAHEKLRADFHTKYDAAMNRLANDYKQAHGSPTTGYLHRRCRAAPLPTLSPPRRCRLSRPSGAL